MVNKITDICRDNRNESTLKVKKLQKRVRSVLAAEKDQARKKEVEE